MEQVRIKISAIFFVVVVKASRLLVHVSCVAGHVYSNIFGQSKIILVTLFFSKYVKRVVKYTEHLYYYFLTIYALMNFHVTLFFFFVSLSIEHSEEKQHTYAFCTFKANK